MSNQTEADHASLVIKLLKSGEDIRAALTAEDCNIWHCATGVSGEAGELLDAVKKVVAYRKPIDLDNVIEELGDIEFYMQGLRNALNITREETLVANMKKLSVRYSKGYSDKAAQDRADKTGDK